MRFLVMRSSDGVFRAAFDGCVIYPSVRINTETGSCNPIPLNRVSKNGKVIITVADLQSGIAYFQ
ncbi:MAG: hypothetical protein ABSG94_07710 [Brevinematales bacterium]